MLGSYRQIGSDPGYRDVTVHLRDGNTYQGQVYLSSDSLRATAMELKVTDGAHLFLPYSNIAWVELLPS